MKSKKIFKPMDCVRMLTTLGTRQGKVADKAMKYICDTLKISRVPFVVESFNTFLPMVQSAQLKIGSKNYPCIGCGMTSGEIPVTHLASSLMSSRILIDTPVIYSNPQCKAASPTNFSFAPAIAVSPEVMKKLLDVQLAGKSSNAKASLKVKKLSVQAHYVLAGNMRNPRTIVFSHYDSLGPGAIDNASGTTVALDVLLQDPSTLDSTLFVFDGNEEVSYDYPTYWGHGYRAFEKRYKKLLESAEQIIVADCVGNGPTTFIRDPKILNLAFPLAEIDRLKDKVSVLSGDVSDLMSVYHSELDVPRKILAKYLNEASKLLLYKCKKY